MGSWEKGSGIGCFIQSHKDPPLSPGRLSQIQAFLHFLHFRPGQVENKNPALCDKMLHPFVTGKGAFAVGESAQDGR